MNVLLISGYELGRQPYGLASPAASLAHEGAEVRLIDLAVEPLDEGAVARAELIAFYIPMHTATRVCANAARRVREINLSAHICFYGLYAAMNEGFLRSLGAQTVLAGEFEAGLVSLYRRLADGTSGSQVEPVVSLARQEFHVPDRSGLPALSRYAHIELPSGDHRIAGYTEATRGCKHTCRHCPIVPVYSGRFRAIPREIVLEDIRRQVASGAQHITFGDPDFLNGPTHSIRIVEAVHREFPDVTYDVTAKVEHLLKQADLLPYLRDTGCIFVTTAVEAVDDAILEILAKGHTVADFVSVVNLCDAAELPLNPTFVAFTPWTTRAGYLDLLSYIARLGLVESVAPIQYAIRLLIPQGSLLFELREVRDLVKPFDPESLCYPWDHPDPMMDELHEDVRALVSRGNGNRSALFDAVWRMTAERLPNGLAMAPDIAPSRQEVPRTSEPWYCCAEPVEAEPVPI